MNIRLMEPKDLDNIKTLWEKYFKDEFTFPDFNKFLYSFVIENDMGIVTAGGLRPIAESILITDMSAPSLIRREGLLNALHTSLLAAGRMNFDSIHAFVKSPNWIKQLQKYGFKNCAGNALYL